MRAARTLLVSSALSIAVVLCLAGSAMASITSAQSSVSVDSSNPSKVQVYSSYSQDGAQTINVSNFIMPRWDATCSQAGYPELGNGGHPNGVIDGPDDASFSSNIFEHISNFTLNPISQETCIGTVAYTDDQVVVNAHPGFYREPFLESTSDSATSSSITINLDLTPNSLATTYSLSYFKPNHTTNCNSPDPDDLLAGVQNTEGVDVTDDLTQVHNVSATITGLTKETEYCVTWHATNAAGNAYSVYGSFTTLGDVPTITDPSFSGVVGGFNFGVDINPEIASSDATLSIEYFQKSGDSCVEPEGGPTVYGVYYDDGGVGLRGYSPIHVEGSVDGLSPGATYCVRPAAYNYYGNADAATYQTVTTVSKAAASVANAQIEPSNDPDYPISLEATFDDHGAYDDTNDASSFSYDIFENTPDRCNATDYFGGQNTVGGNGTFQGEKPFSVGLGDITPGQGYCVAFHLDSSWGDNYDADYYFAFFGGTAPEVTDVTASADHDAIGVTASLDAGYQATDWGSLSLLLDGAESCGDAVHENEPDYNPGGTVGMGVGGAHAVAMQIPALVPNAHYCVKVTAENDLGDDSSDWIAVDTGDALDTTPPTAPSSLFATGTTQTASTLHWTASTDDVGVTEYKIYKNGNAAGTSATLSKDVDLLCGQTDHFRVTAFDAQGNESEQSDELNVTGAACTIPPPATGGDNTTPPTPKRCFTKIKAKSVSGKNKKKKFSVKLTFSIAADGQSITLSSKVKGTIATYKLDGAKVKLVNGAITIRNGDPLLTVIYKVGKKTKTIKLQTTRVSC
jgi:chitodextrinase